MSVWTLKATLRESRIFDIICNVLLFDVAEYNAELEALSVCRIPVHHMHGFLSSVDMSTLLNGNVDCTWEIQAPPRSKVQFVSAVSHAQIIVWSHSFLSAICFSHSNWHISDFPVQFQSSLARATLIPMWLNENWDLRDVYHWECSERILLFWVDSGPSHRQQCGVHPGLFACSVH